LTDNSKTVNADRGNEADTPLGGGLYPNQSRLKAFLSESISSTFRKIVKDNENLPLWISGAGYSGYRFFQMQSDWPIVDSVDVIDRFCTVIKSRASRIHADMDGRGFYTCTLLNDLHANIHPALVRKSELDPGVASRKLVMMDAARASQTTKGRYDRR
jgi:hypothetical protein